MQSPGSRIDQVTTAFVTKGPSEKDQRPFLLTTLKFKQLKSSTATSFKGIKKLVNKANTRSNLLNINKVYVL